MTNPKPSDTVRFLDSITKRADIQGRRKNVLLDRGDRLVAQVLKLSQDEREWNTDNPEHDKLNFAAALTQELRTSRKPRGKI